MKSDAKRGGSRLSDKDTLKMVLNAFFFVHERSLQFIGSGHVRTHDVWREVETARGIKMSRPSDDRQTAWTLK